MTPDSGSPVRIEPVDSLGTLITLTPERFTTSNPEHLALAKRVRELLERAGLLGRGTRRARLPASRASPVVSSCEHLRRLTE